MKTLPLIALGVLLTASVMASEVRQDSLNDFEGEIERINETTKELEIRGLDGRVKKVQVTPESIHNYSVRDFVRIYGTGGSNTTVTKENNRHFEGRIVKLDTVTNTISLADNLGRKRTATVKPDVISNYKVDDIVRVYFEEDLQKAKKIKTISSFTPAF